MDSAIIELLANKWGIFVKHDLIVYENSNDGVRVCLLISETTHLLDQIINNSSLGSWNQQIVV